jgi:hypothetical protein
MLCVVCTMHIEARSTDFFVEPQNQGRRVSRFEPQNRQLRFVDLDLKITATVSWFGPQNQAGFSLSVAPQNQKREVSTGYTSGSSSLLHVEALLARVSSLVSRLAKERWWLLHVAPLQRLRRVEVEDGWVDTMGCVAPFYPNITVFYVLGPMSDLVFNFLVGSTL